MNISINNLWAVAYTDDTGNIRIHSKLFDDKEDAQSVAKILAGVVQRVSYSTY